jgi:hypothetical protein
VKANWRQAGWNQQKHDEVLYVTAGAGLSNTHNNNVEPMKRSGGRFDSFDKLFD